MNWFNKLFKKKIKINKNISSEVFRYIDKEMEEIGIEDYKISIIDDYTLEVIAGFKDGCVTEEVFVQKVYNVQTIYWDLIDMKLNEYEKNN